MTELIEQKCKRCGLYEKDSIKSDDVFDEWELCPDDFLAPDGKYLRVKEKEFNLTLSCRQCLPLEPSECLSQPFHITCSLALCNFHALGCITPSLFCDKKCNDIFAKSPGDTELSELLIRGRMWFSLEGMHNILKLWTCTSGTYGPVVQVVGCMAHPCKS